MKTFWPRKQKQPALLAEELVREVDGRVEDAEPVLPQRRRDRLDRDGAHVLGAAVGPPLDEVLLVEVVREARDEDVDVLHDAQHVEPLVERAHRQVVVRDVEPVLLEREVAHVGVRHPVVQRDRRQRVEHALEVARHLGLDVEELFKDAERLELEEGPQLARALLLRVRRRHELEVLGVDA